MHPLCTPPGHFGITEGAADTCAATSVIAIALAHIKRQRCLQGGVLSFAWGCANERSPRVSDLLLLACRLRADCHCDRSSQALGFCLSGQIMCLSACLLDRIVHDF